jgi:spore coat polysaccharide biosynthesis protein SpsF (cytidylyltransferase family)
MTFVVAVLQARMSSSRLPGKVLLEINGQPMIWWQIQRILKSNMVDKVIVATSTDSTDDVLAEYLENENITCSRGPLEDVLRRFQEALVGYPDNSTIVRLTADCPLIMPEQLDQLVKLFIGSDYDYISNAIVPTFPDGLDIEIFSKSAFNRILSLETSPADKEHVTLKFKDKKETFKILNYESDLDLSSLRWTVDYPQDFQFIRSVFGHFAGRELEFGYVELLEKLKTNPELRNPLPGSLRNTSIKKVSDEFKR